MHREVGPELKVVYKKMAIIRKLSREVLVELDRIDTQYSNAVDFACALKDTNAESAKRILEFHKIIEEKDQMIMQLQVAAQGQSQGA